MTSTAIERAMQHVEMEPTSGCWIWIGARDHHGYGRLSVEGHNRKAHRVFYVELRGPIPAGMTLDHLCRLRPCVNPWHGEPASNRDNILRGASFSAVNARKEACPLGHPYEHPAHSPKRRQCRVCKQRTDREADLRRQERVHA